MDPKELNHLVAKIEARRGRVRLGLLVAVGGFTEGVDTALARQANADHLVLTLDAADLTGWIDATDRIAWVRERVRRGTLRE